MEGLGGSTTTTTTTTYCNNLLQQPTTTTYYNNLLQLLRKRMGGQGRGRPEGIWRRHPWGRRIVLSLVQVKLHSERDSGGGAGKCPSRGRDPVVALCLRVFTFALTP